MAPTLRYYRDLVLVLVTKELKLRYKFTVLGYAWSVLHPLAFALIFFVVIQKCLNANLPDYPVFLICGLFPWHWFQNSLTASNNFFLGNWTLIKKVRFPRSTLVLAGVLNDLVHFVASIPVIVAFMLYFGKLPSAAWLYQIPLLVAVQFGFTFGLSLLTATANLFFRDLERLTAILALLWFYATPILIPANRIPASLQWVMTVNPMAPLIECWHRVFLEGALPPDLAGLAAAYAALAFVVGYAVYRRHEWRFAEVV